MKPPDDTRTFVSETATRRVRDTGRALRLPETDLYPRLRSWLARMGRLDRADDVESLLDRSCDVVAELFEVAHFRLCRYVPGRGFEAFADRDAGADDRQARTRRIDDTLLVELADVLDWACRSRRPVFFELTDDDSGRISTPAAQDTPLDDDTVNEPTEIRPDTRTVNLDNATVNLARLKRANAIAVLPVLGDQGPLGAVLAWLREPSVEERVLESELLRHLVSELSRRASAMLATTRMRELSSLFDNILESVPHGIIAVGRDGVVMALNANAEFLFDIKRVFVLDEPFRTALPERLGRELSELMEKLLVNPSVESRIELELKPGTVMSIGVSASFLYDRAGERQGYLFLCRDLTLSLEVQKLRDLDRMKTEFVNTVSHELKTPLTAILGGMEIIQSANAIHEEYRELGEVIESSAFQLKELIFELLDLAKLESGKVQLKQEPVNVADLLQATARMLPPHPNHEVIVDADSVPAIHIDREKIGRALVNYLSNAVKYSPDGGEVRATARVEDGCVVIAVSDQGMGIDGDNIERIWEKFFRVDAGFTAEIEGTGLGLVIVRKIVELHGGEVFVESTPGTGSTFGMRLPLRTETDQETEP